MLTDADIGKLQKLTGGDLPQLVLTKNDTPQYDMPHDFCALLETHTDIIIKRADDDNTLPGIKINRQITYHAVPSGPELDPFVAALGKITSLNEQFNSTADKIVGPVHIEIYVAPLCPFCPRAVEILLPLTTITPLVKIAVIDATLFDTESERAGIKTTPTTLMDQAYRWIGLPPADEIIAMAAGRDPSALSPSALRGMIAEGDAEGLARLMAESGKIFPGLITLLTDAEWSTRLGAMATFEYLVELDRNNAALYIDPLWNRLEKVDPRVQGDIACLLGEAQCPRAFEKLQGITQGDYSEAVQEAAAEALESLERYIGR